MEIRRTALDFTPAGVTENNRWLSAETPLVGLSK